jgi:hypothetical protein
VPVWAAGSFAVRPAIIGRKQQTAGGGRLGGSRWLYEVVGKPDKNRSKLTRPGILTSGGVLPNCLLFFGIQVGGAGAETFAGRKTNRKAHTWIKRRD